jgi:hypothetical protein
VYPFTSDIKNLVPFISTPSNSSVKSLTKKYLVVSPVNGCGCVPFLDVFVLMSKVVVLCSKFENTNSPLLGCSAYAIVGNSETMNNNTNKKESAFLSIKL